MVVLNHASICIIFGTTISTSAKRKNIKGTEKSTCYADAILIYRGQSIFYLN